MLTYNYTFRDIPEFIKMKMYPYVIGCATGSAKPWAELARKLQPVDADGIAGWYDNLFDQYIAYLDNRFDDKNMHKQGEKQLLADVLKVKYSDGSRSLPFDARIEKFFSLLFTKLRNYAEVKNITTTDAYMEQQTYDHVFEQMPRFMAEHISVLTMPNDVELVIEQIRPKLRQQYNFAKSKDMPLTDKEHAGPGSNVHETSKQYNTQRFGKRNDKRSTRSFLNVDLRTKKLGRGHCWWCFDKGHNLFECSQAKAVAEDNTRKGKNFDDTNREAVRKFKADNEWKEAAHDRGHGDSKPCRHCGEPRHDGKSCRDAKGKQSAFQNSQVDEEQMKEALREEMRQEMRAVIKAEAELAVKSANSVSKLQFQQKEPAAKLNPYQTHGAGAADQ